MAKYQINDRVASVRFYAGTDRIAEVLKTGTIKGEPFNIEGMDHYKCEWDDMNPRNIEVFVVDARTKKYGYVKI